MDLIASFVSSLLNLFLKSESESSFGFLSTCFGFRSISSVKSSRFLIPAHSHLFQNRSCIQYLLHSHFFPPHTICKAFETQILSYLPPPYFLFLNLLSISSVYFHKELLFSNVVLKHCTCCCNSVFSRLRRVLLANFDTHLLCT